jgi:hypothetical protein
MNVGESKDVATLLRWLTGTANEDDTAERAREAAVRLGMRSYETLAVGLNTDQIRQQWPAARSDEAARVRILQLEEAVLASAQLVFDEVPAEPKGLESWYSQNLYEMAEDIKEALKARGPALDAVTGGQR